MSKEIETLRDEMFRAAERIVSRDLSGEECERLIEAYNRDKESDYYQGCKKAIEEVFNVNIDKNVTFEESTDVKKIIHASKILRTLSALSTRPK